MRLAAGLLSLALIAGCKSLSMPVLIGDSFANETRAWAIASNQFGFEVYQELALENELANLVFSPVGLATSISMVGLGAGGETRTAFRSLGRICDPATLLGALGTTQTLGRGVVRMNVGLFVASQMPLLPSYVGAINQIPSATIQQVDFFSDPVGARRTINLWGAEASQGKIIDLLQPADLDGSTRMVAADIVYFKAPWLFPFDPSATTVRPFYINSVSAVDVPMMEATELLPHNHGKGATWIELPYARDPTGDHQIVMFIVMPERDFADFESNWNWELVQGALLELKQQPVHLVVPKWAFRFRENWNSILRRMGLGVAFSNRADFSGIDGAQDLALGNVIEETWISVDEQGTEAVSGSAASLMVKGIRMENPVEVVINRPFLFVIYDRSLGQVLFMGRVMSPAN